MSDKNTTKILFKQIKENLQKSSYAQDYLKSIGWTEKEIHTAPIGYISSNDLFKKTLNDKGADIEVLKKWGLTTANMDFRIVVGWQQPDNSIKLNGFSFGNKNKDDKPVIFQDGFKKDKPFLYAQSKFKKAPYTIIVNSALDSARLQANGYASIALGGTVATKDQVEHLVSESTDYIYIIEDTPKARISAEKLILELSKYNINVKIAQIKNKESTEESIFTSMPSSSIAHYIKAENLIDEGTYMGSRINSQYKSGTNKSKIDQKIKQWRRAMPNKSKESYDKELNKNSVPVETDIAEILRVYASLLDLNIDQAEAKAIVKRRFNVYVNIKDFNADD